MVKKISIIFLIIISILIIPSFTKAAKLTVDKVKGVKVSAKTTTTLKLTWKGVSKAKGYKVYLYNASKKKYELKTTTKNTTYTLKNLKSSQEYKIKIRAYRKIKNKTYHGAYSSIIITATIPEQATNIKVTKQGDTWVSLSWSKVPRATGYKIYEFDNSTKTFHFKQNSYTNTAKVVGLESAKEHKLRVAAYKTTSKKSNYVGKKSPFVTTFTKPSKVSGITTTKATIDSIKFSWTKQNGVELYQIYQYNTSSKKYEKIAETKDNTYSMSNLKIATEYKFKLRTYMLYNNVKYYGGYSNVFETSTVPGKVTNLKVSGATENSISIKWNKTEFADGYGVYLYHDSGMKYKLYKNSTETSLKITGLTAAKFYKIYVKAYVTVDNKNYYGQACDAISQKTDSTKSAIAGVDVSRHNGTVNWEKVKALGVDFAIIRCGWGKDVTSQDDSQYKRNISECERLGIPYGVYIYSYALNTANAESEAEHTIRLLGKHKPQYGVWFDMEDADAYKEKNGMPKNKELVDICVTFCEKLIKAGYETGIYASLSWFNNQLNSSRLDKYEKWIAHWADNCGYKNPFKMWQYTDVGKVEGITGNVDLNIIYLEK